MLSTASSATACRCRRDRPGRTGRRRSAATTIGPSQRDGLMAIDPDLIDAVRRFDGQIRRLQDYGLALDEPGWVARLMSRQQPMAAMYAEEQAVRQEVDRLAVWPRLIDAYLRGGADDRRELRELLRRFDRFGGGPESHRIARPTVPATHEEMLRAFAFFAMSDGDSDWRDEKLWLDALCAIARDSGLDVAALLREAAALAGADRRGSRPSLRETLLAAATAAGGSSPLG